MTRPPPVDASAVKTALQRLENNGSLGTLIRYPREALLDLFESVWIQGWEAGRSDLSDPALPPPGVPKGKAIR
jgi:hypothetical protein